jgi:hypothetical protein
MSYFDFGWESYTWLLEREAKVRKGELHKLIRGYIDHNLINILPEQERLVSLMYLCMPLGSY